MNCEEACGLLAAYADGELDLPRALRLEQHLDSCATCAAALRGLRAQSRALRAAPYHRAPETLRERLRAQPPLAAASPVPAPSAPARRGRRDWSRWALPLAASVTLAVSINLFWPAQGQHDALDDELVSGHVRSLQAEHLADVISTDLHTVKPWFAGKLDYSPPVRDFTAQDFPLAGGRLDYVDHRQVSVLIYHHRKHIINLYVWPTGTVASTGASGTRDGYNLLHWSAEGMDWWAVSDVSTEGLHEFAMLEQTAGKDAAANAPNS